MTFTRFVEVGRVALISYGPQAGKLATIIDVVDANKALVDGPEALTGVSRQTIPLRWLSLTDIKVKIPRHPRSKTLSTAWTKGEVLKKWSESAWAKKIAARKARAEATDFDRFKIMVARKQKSRAIKKKVAELRKQA